MAEISFADDLPVGLISFRQHVYDMAEAADATGDASYRTFGPPRWGCTVRAKDKMTLTEGGRWEAVMAALRGGVNYLSIHDRGKPVPEGTCRGSLTLASGLSAGASSMSLSGFSGTLLRGDWLQIGTGCGTSQTVKVTADTSNGTVSFSPPIRLGLSFNSGTSVSWNKPLIYMRLAGDMVGWDMLSASLTDGHTMDLLETFKA